MLTRDILESLGTRFLLVLLGATGSILLTRALGPEGRGLYLGVTSLAMLGAQFATLGMTSSNTYFLNGDREPGRNLAANSVVLALVLGTLTSLACWLPATQVHGLLPGVGLAAMLAGLATIPVQLLLLFGQNLLIARGAFRSYNLVELIRNLGWMGVVITGFLMLGWGFRTAIWLNLTITALAAAWVWSRLGTLGLPFSLAWHGGTFSRTIGYGLRAYVATLMYALVARLDLFMIQHYRGAVESGQFGVALQFADLFTVIPATVAMVVFPKASALGRASWPLVRRTALITGGALGVLLLLMGAMAPDIIRILFGPSFSPAAKAFQVMIPGLLFLGIESIAVLYLSSIGLPITLLVAWGSTLAIKICLNLYLVQKMGMLGGSLSTSIAFTLISILVLMIIWSDRRKLSKGVDSKYGEGEC